MAKAQSKLQSFTNLCVTNEATPVLESTAGSIYRLTYKNKLARARDHSYHINQVTNQSMLR